MNKPLIGITAGEIINLQHREAPTVHGQGFTYFRAVELAGGVPIMLPIEGSIDTLDQVSGMLDGLLLAGGNDIHPNLYGAQPYTELEEPSFRRDTVERQYLDNALNAGIPVLGICRGMQFVNVFKGGTLFQDIPTDVADALKHESSVEGRDMDTTDHPIKIERGSRLHRILGKTSIETNSYHHQAVKDLGEGLRATAWSPDGIIEGLESTDEQFIIGVQAHPESLVENEAVLEWRNLFRAFVERAATAEHAAVRLAA